ncbi:DUF3149 domain-containing protein [Thalassotalea atypica]|nr:DUF3149 domain-containing protein [Thalassotalea atypica]
MELLKSFANDPVFWFSMAGLAIVLGICSFYVYYFLKNIAEDK